MMTGMPASFAFFTAGDKGVRVRRGKHDCLDTAVNGALDNVDLLSHIGLGLRSEECHGELGRLCPKLRLGREAPRLDVLPVAGVSRLDDDRDLLRRHNGATKTTIVRRMSSFFIKNSLIKFHSPYGLRFPFFASSPAAPRFSAVTFDS